MINKIVQEDDFLILYLNVVIHLAFADTNLDADDNVEKINDYFLPNYKR